MRDHLELKHLFELEERAKNEENESIRQDNLALRNEIRFISSETKNVVLSAKEQYEINAEEYGDRFRSQIREHDSNMSMIRDQYNKLSHVYKVKMNAMRD